MSLFPKEKIVGIHQLFCDRATAAKSELYGHLCSLTETDFTETNSARGHIIILLQIYGNKNISIIYKIILTSFHAPETGYNCKLT